MSAYDELAALGQPQASVEAPEITCPACKEPLRVAPEDIAPGDFGVTYDFETGGGSVELRAEVKLTVRGHECLALVGLLHQTVVEMVRRGESEAEIDIDPGKD